ncbi:hypothetical protein GCM10009828_012290 [Actinoplanes couchii]|uniref:Excalibur calcium-binding domain-containing protein n=1 Tax=Actinoplanes couchii TaxID=403638 RepID=A0ABQ3XJ69_9ACTN|nr:hypothetical protein Aco03nite_069400 [Actinoplanes couchii]
MKNISVGIGALVLFCCGGTAIIGSLGGDPEPATNRAAGVAATIAAEVAGSPAPEATGEPGTATTGAGGTSTPRPGTTPASRPAAEPTTTRPSPKSTTKKPKPRPTTAEPEDEPEEEVVEDVYYKNCTAVRRAGADPIRRGDPGYGRHLDRDGDGVGCE